MNTGARCARKGDIIIGASLFPLHLTPFEHMMVLEDRASHPMTCRARFTYEGHLDRERFSQAYAAALQHRTTQAWSICLGRFAKAVASRVGTSGRGIADAPV